MSVGKRQAAYITDLLNGLTVTEIAKKHGVKQPTVSQAIHRALGKEYKGRIVHGIKMSAFRQIIEEANNGLWEQGTGGMA